jgi:hypothetical protein
MKLVVNQGRKESQGTGEDNQRGRGSLERGEEDQTKKQRRYGIYSSFIQKQMTAYQAHHSVNMCFQKIEIISTKTNVTNL